MTPLASAAARLAASLKRFGRDEDGNGTVELVIALPVLMFVFLTGFESAYLMTRQIMLERATDLVVRDIRLGRMPNPDVADMKAAICARTVILAECEENLAINLQRVSKTTWGMPQGEIPCVDRIEEIDPSLIANPNMPSDVMLVRACILQDALFPGTGIGAGLVQEADNGYPLIAVSAFVNEP